MTGEAYFVPVLADLGVSIRRYEILVRLRKERGLHIIENLFDIDPSLQVIGKIDALFDCFSLELFAVEVTAA